MKNNKFTGTTWRAQHWEQDRLFILELNYLISLFLCGFISVYPPCASVLIVTVKQLQVVTYNSNFLVSKNWDSLSLHLELSVFKWPKSDRTFLSGSFVQWTLAFILWTSYYEPHTIMHLQAASSHEPGDSIGDSKRIHLNQKLNFEEKKKKKLAFNCRQRMQLQDCLSTCRITFLRWLHLLEAVEKA